MRTLTFTLFGNSSEDNFDAADRLREQIYESIQALLQFPHQGHWRSDLTSKRLRFQTVGNYLIAYAPDENPLLVLAVLHGRRNPRTDCSDSATPR